MATGNKEFQKPHYTINSLGFARNAGAASKYVPSKAIPNSISIKNSESFILSSENQRPSGTRWKRTTLGTSITTNIMQGRLFLQLYLSSTLLLTILLSLSANYR